jgi:hypothetical protein
VIRIKKEKNKYQNKICYFDGFTFKSIKEMERYIELKADPDVEDLKCHPRFIICPESDEYKAVIYEADFLYRKNGELIVEDVKGMKRGVPYELFKLKKKLMYHFHGIIVREI